MVEVAVSGKQGQSVLDRKRRNPDVIGGDGCALLAQLIEQMGVVMGRRLRLIQDGYLRGVEEASQGALVFTSSCRTESRRATQPARQRAARSARWAPWLAACCLERDARGVLARFIQETGVW